MKTHMSVILACLSLMAMRCNTNDRVIRYCLPNEYRGYFWVVVDRKNGQEVDTRGGLTIINVPKNGIVKVKDDSFLVGPHKTMAQFNSGEIIPVYGEADANDVMIIPLSGSTGVRTIYLIGTKKDRQYYFRDPGGDGQLEAVKELNRRLAIEGNDPLFTK
jgi:hypothetical protein